MQKDSGFEIDRGDYTGKTRIEKMKDYTIAVAGTGAGDIIGTTKKHPEKSRLLAD